MWKKIISKAQKLYPARFSRIVEEVKKSQVREHLDEVEVMHAEAWGYQSGFGTRKDPQKAQSLIKKLLAANYGPTHYYYGLELEKQGFTQEAMKHYQIAASQTPHNENSRSDIAAACTEVASAYFQGMYGFRKDVKEGSILLQKAVDLGDVEAMATLGDYLINGLNGLEKNEERGVELLQQAAVKGIAKAQHNLGMIYYHGNSVVKKDLDFCIEYWKMASEQDFPPSLYKLGMLCLKGYVEEGWNIPKDTALAEMFLKKFVELYKSNNVYKHFRSEAQKAQKELNELLKTGTVRSSGNAIM